MHTQRQPLRKVYLGWQKDFGSAQEDCRVAQLRRATTTLLQFGRRTIGLSVTETGTSLGASVRKTSNFISLQIACSLCQSSLFHFVVILSSSILTTPAEQMLVGGSFYVRADQNRMQLNSIKADGSQWS